MAPAHFRALDWNVGGKRTSTADFKAHIRGTTSSEWWVSVWLLQEVSEVQCASLKPLGIDFVKAPKASNAVAWDTSVWEKLSHDIVDLADPYEDETRGGKVIHTQSPLVRLKHRKSGTVILALSYHLPSRVQNSSIKHISKERIRVHKQALARLDLMGKNRVVPLLFGGDDNVQEGSAKAWLWHKTKNLIQVVANVGTLGGRKIDDFRVKGLKPRGVETFKTTSDHKSHLRGFDFIPPKPASKPKPKPAPKPAPKPIDKMDPKSYFVGAKGDHVKWYAQRLVAHGYGRFYKNGVDRHFTAGEDKAATTAFQRAQGWRGSDADGLPGRETLRRVAAAPKPKPASSAMKFVSRATWKARARGATTRSHPIGATKGVTLHWEGPEMGDFPHSACDDKVRGIEKYHRDTKKWADIAYNAIVCPHGYVFEGRGIGVKSAANGNTQDNDDWYAVCYLGGEGDPFTEAGKQGFRDAVTWLREAGAGSRVNGHRDHKSTACPGDAIYRWLRAEF